MRVDRGDGGGKGAVRTGFFGILSGLYAKLLEVSIVESQTEGRPDRILTGWGLVKEMGAERLHFIVQLDSLFHCVTQTVVGRGDGDF